jgi:hypothetical protein
MADPNERNDYGGDMLMCLLLILAVLLVIPVLMLVFGIKNDELVCQSTTCIDLECNSVSNKPLHLGAPSIGITVSQALIVGGCFGILISGVAFANICYSYFKSTKPSKPVAMQQPPGAMQQPRGQQPTMKITRQQSKLQTYISISAGCFSILVCLAVVCWMCVSFAVYSQYNQMCSDYNPKFSIVPSSSMNLLLASNIIGIICAFCIVANLFGSVCRCEDEFSQGCCRDCCETV